MTASAGGMFRQGQRRPAFLVFFLLSTHSQAAPCDCSGEPAEVGNKPCKATGDPHFRTFDMKKCVSHTYRLSRAHPLPRIRVGAGVGSNAPARFRAQVRLHGQGDLPARQGRPEKLRL